MKIYFCLMIAMISSVSASHASPEKELNQLESRILTVKKQLSAEEQTRAQYYKQLAKIEKEMSEDLRALHLLTPDETQKKQAIQSMNQQIESLNAQLKTQEKLLANHVRARHQLGATHPWLWLLNQQTPREMSRLYVFYQYLFKADERLIESMRVTRATYLKQQTLLSQEQKKLTVLQKKLLQHQQRLSLLKQKQQSLITTLEQHIQSNNQQLKLYHQNKARLQALVTKLSQRSLSSGELSTLKLEGKYLSSPLDKLPKTRKSLNQGIVFLTNEGTPVVSVLPGKVVFSDWLKGYGLLLIIDHGHGVMSLYAHNASLFKTRGAAVEQGEQIATVGHTGGLRENGLYFEIRRRGKTVPPREWIS